MRSKVIDVVIVLSLSLNLYFAYVIHGREHSGFEPRKQP